MRFAWRWGAWVGAGGLLITVLAAGSRQTPVQAAEARVTAGQLELRDRSGKAAGLCPLKHTAVRADVAGQVARVAVRQEFQNTSCEPVEAVYTFPLPEDAAVDNMVMTVGDRVIRGRIQRREEARALYERARQSGQAAALLDQERPNIFTQSVANLMPGASLSVTIEYVQVLKYDHGQYEFVYPMVVGPRYTPAGGYRRPGERGAAAGDVGVPEAGGTKAVVTDPEKVTPPITPPNTRAGHDITVEVRLDAGLPLRNVTSALHELEMDRPGPNRAAVRLRGGRTIPNKDFVLRWSLEGEEPAISVLPHARKEGDGYFTLIVQPPAEPRKQDIAPKEMVFVLDQTGSQSGLPIQKAKETMAFCLENLNPGDTFQVIGFNTQVFPCFPAPVPVNESNLQAALRFLRPLEGNGGTDILKSVEYALRLPADPARPRIICYLTDGFVGNDMQILDYIRKHRGQARMFPFGVGNGVNRFLIDGMAREGRGAPYYVLLNTPGAQAASRFYDRVQNPLLLDVQVEWNGLPVADVFPKHIPDVFSSTPIVLKGRYTRSAEGEVTVRGLLRGRPWSRTYPVRFPRVHTEGSAIPTLWAREKIEDLQSQDWNGAQQGTPNAAIRDQIVGVALDYRLMSQYTSFVAVEERVVNVGGQNRRIDVPVELTDGVAYEGIFEQQRGRGTAASRVARRPSLLSLGVQGKAPGAGGGFGGGLGGAALPPAASPAPTRPPARPELAPTLSEEKEGLRDGSLKRASTPQERRAQLADQKLAPALRLLVQPAPASPLTGILPARVERGRVTIQLWVRNLPADGLQKLKALGFALSAELRPGVLVLGTLPVTSLAKVVELEWVQRVEPPAFR